VVLGNPAFFLDVASILAVSAAIVFASNRLIFMSLWVPTVLIVRFVAYSRLPATDRPWSTAIEIAVILGCAALGGFNDWNSVVHHQIYDYTVPADIPLLSTIPTWMLLFWGLVLRALFTLYRWRGLSPEKTPRDDVFLGRHVTIAWLKVAVQLGIIVATRQAIYRLFDDPIASWIPFAAALLIWALLCRPGAHAFRVLGIMLVLGPIVEAIYIRLGRLHQYHLGIFFGVPIWIMLWWALATVIWGDLSFRVARLIAH
jgi:hypothetical protein